MEETDVPREDHRPVASYWQTLSHNVVSSTSHHERGRTHNFCDRYEISIPQMTIYLLLFTYSFPVFYHCQYFYWIILVTRRVFYKKQELLTLREHLSSPPGLWWWPCCSSFYFFCVLLCVFTFWVPLRDVQHILCCVFALFVYVLCFLCATYCQFLRIVHFWLPLLYSLTFIQIAVVLLRLFLLSFFFSFHDPGINI